MTLYILIFIILLALELFYFKIADKFNIIDKPNERSSHSTIVLRGGGIVFALSILVWIGLQIVIGAWDVVIDYLPFICGLVLIAGVSFVDDILSLPDSVRLVAQFSAMALMFWSMGLYSVEGQWMSVVLIVFLALIVSVGAMNIINFMDGINGITGGYALAVLVPLLLLDVSSKTKNVVAFIEPSYLVVAIIGVLVFCLFNFRSKGKAKCFAGDVGSIGIAFIMLFAIGKLIVQTEDLTYLILLIVYGVDGCMTIFHRIMLHENLGQAHRKHVYQLLANELKMDHVKVSLLYMAMQMVISLGFIYLCPNSLILHWIYLIATGIVLTVTYVIFIKKYYHLHEEYLATLR